MIVSIVITAIFTILFVGYWTWLRFRRIAQKKEIDKFLKRIWWILLILSSISLIVMLILFYA